MLERPLEAQYDPRLAANSQLVSPENQPHSSLLLRALPAKKRCASKERPVIALVKVFVRYDLLYTHRCTVPLVRSVKSIDRREHRRATRRITVNAHPILATSRPEHPIICERNGGRYVAASVSKLYPETAVGEHTRKCLQTIVSNQVIVPKQVDTYEGHIRTEIVGRGQGAAVTRRVAPGARQEPGARILQSRGIPVIVCDRLSRHRERAGGWRLQPWLVDAVVWAFVSGRFICTKHFIQSVRCSRTASV